jgi:hypothetical protein
MQSKSILHCKTKGYVSARLFSHWHNWLHESGHMQLAIHLLATVPSLTTPLPQMWLKHQFQQPFPHKMSMIRQIGFLPTSVVQSHSNREIINAIVSILTSLFNNRLKELWAWHVVRWFLMKCLLIIRRRSNINGTSVSYTWPACDISMSLAYIGMSSSEVAALVSFSIHMSQLYKQTKWPMWLKIIPSLGSARWLDFFKQKEWVRVRFIAG